MKTINLTEEELNTLLYAVSNQYHRSQRSRIESGKKEKSETEKRLLSISNRLYYSITH